RAPGVTPTALRAPMLANDCASDLSDEILDAVEGLPGGDCGGPSADHGVARRARLPAARAPLTQAGASVDFPRRGDGRGPRDGAVELGPGVRRVPPPPGGPKKAGHIAETD